MKALVPVIAIVGIIVAILLWGIGINNGLVTKDETVKSAWANVNTEYQRRYNLVDNLVSTVKGAAKFEQETLTKVIEARASATKVTISADNLDEASLARFQKAQGELSSALSRLMVVSEQYPDLKTSQNFMELQNELTRIENRVAVSVRDYNATVQMYNTAVRTFPSSLVAGFRNFPVRPTFQATPGSEVAPKVQF